MAFHLSYWVYFLDRYFNKKLDTTFYSFVVFGASFMIEPDIDLGLKVRVIDFDKTKDWLLRRLRGLGIEGKNVFELLKGYDVRSTGCILLLLWYL